MPIHKVDDIAHMNFTDRDHLWFDPNGCKSNSGSNGNSSNNNNDREDRGDPDPMAAMLENNAKNPKVGY